MYRDLFGCLMNGSVDSFHFSPCLATLVYLSVGLSPFVKREKKRCNNADFFHAHRVMAISKSINIVYLLVKTVKMWLQRKNFATAFNFFKNSKSVPN